MSSLVDYLLSLGAIRDRSQILREAAYAGKLSHFDFHRDRMEDVADFTLSVIEAGDLNIMFWRASTDNEESAIIFQTNLMLFLLMVAGSISRLEIFLGSAMSCSSGSELEDLELTRRLIDLFFVSVLLDAGAGDHWRYTEARTEKKYERSEGIAVASLYMFNASAFTTSRSLPMVDGKAFPVLDLDID